MARTFFHGHKPVEAIEVLLYGTYKLCYYISIFLLVPCVELLIRFQKLRAISDISHYAVSDPGLRCLPLSHKKDASLKWVNRSWVAGTIHG